MYLGSKLLASHSTANGTRYFYLDHLGTPRLIKDSAGQVVATHDYYPFGEELVPGTDQERKKFTGHERDFNGSGVDDDLDYMHARYFAPELGRFLQPDPADSYALRFPQSWNRYTYVLNNPLRHTDPQGLWAVGIVPVVWPVWDIGFGEEIDAAEAPWWETWLAWTESILAYLPGMGDYEMLINLYFGDDESFYGYVNAALMFLPPSALARFLGVASRLTKEALAARAAARVINADKLNNKIFAAKHKLGWLESMFSSRDAAYAAVATHMQVLHDAGMLPTNAIGVFEGTISFGGRELFVQVRVMDDVVHVGDFWTP